jgi:hypothetical protein
MARSVAQRRPRLFHATLHVTRVEHWSIEAVSEEEARERLASGEGHRTHTGDRLSIELHTVEE